MGCLSFPLIQTQTVFKMLEFWPLPRHSYWSPSMCSLDTHISEMGVKHKTTLRKLHKLIWWALRYWLNIALVGTVPIPLVPYIKYIKSRVFQSEMIFYLSPVRLKHSVRLVLEWLRYKQPDLMGEVRTKPVSHGCTPVFHAVQPLSTVPPVHSIAGLLDLLKNVCFCMVASTLAIRKPMNSMKLMCSLKCNIWHEIHKTFFYIL